MEFNNKQKTEFICDTMFGKLARWIRMAGYSAIYIKNSERQKFLKNFNLRKNQIFITSDSKILKMDIKIFYLTEENIFLQFKILKEKFHLSFDNAFTICMECNYPLKSINKEKVKDKIPEYVFKNFNDFYECEQCKRLYWKGTHFIEMQKKLNEI